MTSIKKFFFYISMLDREYNKIGKKIDYSCKSHIFRRILILLMNMLNSFDVCWIKYEDMILRPLSSISFWILYSNNRDILNTTTKSIDQKYFPIYFTVNFFDEVSVCFSTNLYFAEKRRTQYQLYLYHFSIRNETFHNCSSFYHSKQLILSHSKLFI
jgi:hypothetical protein